MNDTSAPLVQFSLVEFSSVQHSLIYLVIYSAKHIPVHRVIQCNIALNIPRTVLHHVTKDHSLTHSPTHSSQPTNRPPQQSLRKNRKIRDKNHIASYPIYCTYIHTFPQNPSILFIHPCMIELPSTNIHTHIQNSTKLINHNIHTPERYYLPAYLVTYLPTYLYPFPSFPDIGQQ